MLPRMRHLILEIKMRAWKEIDTTFSDGAAPEICIVGRVLFSSVAVQAGKICVRRVEKWQDQEATCSVEWIKTCVKDVKDG